MNHASSFFFFFKGHWKKQEFFLKHYLKSNEIKIGNNYTTYNNLTDIQFTDLILLIHQNYPTYLKKYGYYFFFII